MAPEKTDVETPMNEDQIDRRSAAKVHFEYQGTEFVADLFSELSSGDPFDPHNLIKTMERIPNLFAFYSQAAREMKANYSFAKERKDAAGAALREAIISLVMVHGDKKPPAAEVERLFLQEIDRADKEMPEDFPELKRYMELKKETHTWDVSASALEAIVETFRMKSSMVRGQASLLEAMMQQNIITRPEPPKIGDETDDGTLDPE
jgi:hypothetical protein